MARGKENPTLIPPDAKQETFRAPEGLKMPPKEIVIDVTRAKEANRDRRGFAKGEDAKVKDVLKGVRGKNILAATEALALAGIVALTTGLGLRAAREYKPSPEKQKLSAADMKQQSIDRYNKNPDVVDAIMQWKQKNPELANKIQDIKIVGVEQKKDLGKQELQGVGVRASEKVVETAVQLAVTLKGGKEIPIFTTVRGIEPPQDSLRQLLDRAVPSTKDAQGIALRRAVEQGLASIGKEKVI